MPRVGQRKRLTQRKRSRSAPEATPTCSLQTVSSQNNTQTPLSSSLTPHSDSSMSKFPHLKLLSPDTSSSVVKKSFPRARSLTSAASLAEIEEKERKKQQELKEKERKRTEREEKRKKKEEEMKRKAEERAKRAEEKAEKAISKGKRPVRKGALSKQKRSVTSSFDTPSTSGVPALKKRRLQGSEEINSEEIDVNECSEEIDVNECSMCFGNYVDDIIESAGTVYVPVGVGSTKTVSKTK